MNKILKLCSIGSLSLMMLAGCSAKISSTDLIKKYNDSINKLSSYESFKLEINQVGTYTDDEKKEKQKIESIDELSFIAKPTQSKEIIVEKLNDEETVTTLYENESKYYLDAAGEKRTMHAVEGQTVTTLVAQYQLLDDFSKYVNDVKIDKKDGITTYTFKLIKDDIKDETKENSTELLKSNFTFDVTFSFDEEENLIEYISKSDQSTITLKISEINKIEKIDLIDFTDYPEIEQTTE